MQTLQAAATAGIAALSVLAAPSALGLMAGAPPDTPAARVDANTTSSPWAGVGSLTVNGSTFSASAIGTRYVLTAAHVASGQQPANITFNLNYGSNLSHRIPAAAVFVHPRFSGVSQYDLAIVELAADIPAGVPIYSLYFGSISPGTTLELVGYGSSGQGSSGISVGADPAIKRTGRNAAEAFAAEADNPGVPALFYYDFDGAGAPNCLGLSGGLGNAVETTVAGGDSGSPAFVFAAGHWQLAAVNTFAFTFGACPVDPGPTTPGVFGTGGGGNLVSAYQAWIQSILTRPVNDTFINATSIAGNAGQASGTNVAATKEAGEPNHAGNAGGKSVWWRWTAPASGSVTITTAGSDFDTLLAVYTGSAVSVLDLVAQDDNDGNPGGTSTVMFAAQARTTYQIAVDGANGAGGVVALNWSLSATRADAEVPMLPPWGLWALAAGLLAVVFRRRAH
jgi:hypothetical protein